MTLNLTSPLMFNIIARRLSYIMLLMLSGCIAEPEDSFEFGTDKKDGFIPVYAASDMTEIKWKPARDLKQPGKIYTYDTNTEHYLFVNEVGEGIHVFDNADPSVPMAMGFIQILGNYDIAIKEDILYADYMGNVASIDLKNFNFSSLSKKHTLKLNDWKLGVPPPEGQYFECIDPSKGVVIDWEPTVKPQIFDCYAVNNW